MARLIDLEPIEEAYHAYCAAGHHRVTEALAWLSHALDSAPMYHLEEDVVAVRADVGSWQPYPVFGQQIFVPMCTCCGVKQEKTSRYCPSCGARMTMEGTT